MQERIIILGAGIMQGPAIRIAKELGLYTVVIDGDSSAPHVPDAHQFEQIDLKDKEGIEAFARSLQSSGGLGGIMTAGTDFSATVAWVAERLGLPGIPYEAALNASDKSRMRACFKKAGLSSPEFITVSAEDFLEELALPAPFPLVVKPVDNMGGRGCRRVDSMEELREAAADALRFSRSGRAIVEAFMDGPEFSVDAIVYHGEITICGLADRHIFFPPCFIEMGHTMPSNFPARQQRAMLETFCDGVRALGLAGRESVGAAKGDIKLCGQGGGAEAPMIGEIAARLSGGYMSGWTYPYSSGAQPIRAAILAAMGRKPDGIVPLKAWTSAERAFISIPGTVKAIAGAGAARSQPHVCDLFFRAAEGDKVLFPENNVSKCGNVISAASGRAAAVEAAEAAVRSILIRLDPADGDTAAFLSESTSFPPGAFQLNGELKSALDALPETAIAPADRERLRLLPFPEFTACGLKDYAGRTIPESLEAVRSLTGLSLPEFPVENAESSDNKEGELSKTSVFDSLLTQGRKLPAIFSTASLKTQPGFPEMPSFLGKSFWAALARGGYQGAVYYIDRLKLF